MSSEHASVVNGESVAFPASTMRVHDIVKEPVSYLHLQQNRFQNLNMKHSTIILSTSGYTLLSLVF